MPSRLKASAARWLPSMPAKFKAEIVPIVLPRRKGDPVIVDTDEHPRYRQENGHYVLDTSLEQLAKLPAAFRKGGTVTAGNSSGINDGAAAILMMSDEKAAQLGLKPKLRWVGSAVAGVDPGVMGYGPVPATEKLLKRQGLKVADLGLIELNEAFAAQAIGCMRKLGLDPAVTNVNGSGIALGHPTGATGARLVASLMYEMARRGAYRQTALLRAGDLVCRRWHGCFDSRRVDRRLNGNPENGRKMRRRKRS